MNAALCAQQQKQMEFTLVYMQNSWRRRIACSAYVMRMKLIKMPSEQRCNSVRFGAGIDVQRECSK